VKKLLISSCRWIKYVSSTNHEYHLIAHSAMFPSKYFGGLNLSTRHDVTFQQTTICLIRWYYM